MSILGAMSFRALAASDAAQGRFRDSRNPGTGERVEPLIVLHFVCELPEAAFASDPGQDARRSVPRFQRFADQIGLALRAVIVPRVSGLARIGFALPEVLHFGADNANGLGLPPLRSRDMAGKLSLKRAFLRTLMVTLVASALFGIYAFLFGDFGETEIKILLTTLSISYFSVTSLSCAVALEKGKGSILAPVGLAAGILGFLVFVPGIWAEWWDSEAFSKSMAILAIFAFSFAQGCLLALVPLKRSIHWAFWATVTAIFVLATFISGMIVFEADHEWFFRIAGVLGILDGCGSLLIPLLYKVSSKPPLEIGGSRSLDSIELACPRCAHRDKYAVGIIRCVECSLEIRVEIGRTP